MKVNRIVSAGMAAAVAVVNTLAVSAESWEEFLNQWNSDGSEIVINLAEDTVLEGALLTKADTTYTINAAGRILTGLSVGGEGFLDVTAGALLGSAECEYSTAGAYFFDNVAARIAADISAGDGICGVVADGSSFVLIEGNVSGVSGAAAADDGMIIMRGDISAENTGIAVKDNGSVIVDGDVTSGGIGMSFMNNACIAVSGDVSGGMAGMAACQSSLEGDNDINVLIGGDLTGGECVFFSDSRGGEVTPSDTQKMKITIGGSIITDGDIYMQPDGQQNTIEAFAEAGFVTVYDHELDIPEPEPEPDPEPEPEPEPEPYDQFTWESSEGRYVYHLIDPESGIKVKGKLTESDTLIIERTERGYTIEIPDFTGEVVICVPNALRGFILKSKSDTDETDRTAGVFYYFEKAEIILK